MARKGWDQLSDAYRKRLLRNGISQRDYDSGKSLGSARGHATPPGLGERKWGSLVRLAKQAEWPQTYDVKSELENELGKGIPPEEIAIAIRDKIAAQKAYKNGDTTRARNIWAKRNPLHAREIYWYHVHK